MDVHGGHVACILCAYVGLFQTDCESECLAFVSKPVHESLQNLLSPCAIRKEHLLDEDLRHLDLISSQASKIEQIPIGACMQVDILLSRGEGIIQDHERKDDEECSYKHTALFDSARDGGSGSSRICRT